MSIKTRIAAIAIAPLTVTAGVTAIPRQAEAGHRGAGIGIGLAAGALMGAAIASNAYAAPVYGYGYRRCGYIRQFDAYGNYIGRVRTCAY